MFHEPDNAAKNTANRDYVTMSTVKTFRPQVDSADPLSEILQDLRLAKADYGRSEFTAPWGLHVPHKDGVRFHFVVEGGVTLWQDKHEPIRLDPGDVVLLPHGTAHVMADDERTRIDPMESIHTELIGDAVYHLSGGGGGKRTLLVCCTIRFEGPTAHPLLELLPDCLVVRKADQSDPSLPTLLDIMAREVSKTRIGTATVMARLADVVVTLIIRAWIEMRRADLQGWLAGVRDPNIGLALAQIHRKPGHAWTVETLASAAGMSRSLFAERFTALMGQTPARYLLQWRIRLATMWIESQRMTVSEAAGRLGYASDAAFSRAFKRVVGAPPSDVRKRRARVIQRSRASQAALRTNNRA
jgi:AraC-like DNA-binding protein/mannose-6-phosphate isomerase-like protein (cupin superfamily)